MLPFVIVVAFSTRPFWLGRLAQAWRRKSVVWLSGVRRTGKTTLARSLPRAEYLDCELPSVRRMLAQPEAFLDARRKRTVVLDESHRLGNPSELLKLAADHYPEIKVLATGTSTLGASRRFRDSLTGRKAELWLTPMMSRDLADFGSSDLERRLLRGGLPAFFLAEGPAGREFQEWLDPYWAKDILELFRLERRHSFQRFVELPQVQSGGLFEATRFARDCEVSRTSIVNDLAVLEATFVAHVIRPYGARRSTEIIAAPKVYGFDTGFVCEHRGIERLRREDFGLLWEHYVLNELRAQLQTRTIRYWRDKRGHEVDFVIAARGKPPVAIECKASSANFDAVNLSAFRRGHPQGLNYVVAPDVTRPFVERHAGLRIEFVGLDVLIRRLSLRLTHARLLDPPCPALWCEHLRAADRAAAGEAATARPLAHAWGSRSGPSRSGMSPPIRLHNRRPNRGRLWRRTWCAGPRVEFADLDALVRQRARHLAFSSILGQSRTLVRAGVPDDAAATQEPTAVSGHRRMQPNPQRLH